MLELMLEEILNRPECVVYHTYKSKNKSISTIDFVKLGKCLRFSTWGGLTAYISQRNKPKSYTYGTLIDLKDFKEVRILMLILAALKVMGKGSTNKCDFKLLDLYLSFNVSLVVSQLYRLEVVKDDVISILNIKFGNLKTNYSLLNN